MRKLFSLIFFNLILFMLVNVNIVFATDSAQMQQINQMLNRMLINPKKLMKWEFIKCPMI